MSTYRPHSLLRLLLAALVLSACWLQPVTELARTEVKDGLERALTVFATARALGAVVSVAQGMSVNVQVGVGLELTPGQALQPLDQLIDQFAEVMLIASASLGIQILLLTIGTHWVISALISCGIIALVLIHWRGKITSVHWLNAVLMMLLVVRFAVPLTILGNEALYRHFIADEVRAELSVMQQSAAKPQSTIGSDAKNEKFSWGGVKERLKDISSVKLSVDSILNVAADWSCAMVKLIAYFVVQTIIFPIAFLWLIWSATLRLMRLALSSNRAQVIH